METTLDTAAAAPEGVDAPALVVAFGATTNRRRALTKATTLLGRGRGCDIRLDAPEVSAVHCILSRELDGFALRDCDSRTGVILNGQPVREARLKDGDLLQIGPFTFRASLPNDSFATPGFAAADAQELERRIGCLQNHVAAVEAERDKLAAQVCELRDACRSASNDGRLAEELAQSQAELTRLRRELDAAVVERDEWRARIECAPAAPDREEELAALSDRVHWLENELQAAQIESNRLKADLEAAQYAASQSARELESLRSQNVASAQARDVAVRERDALRAELDLAAARWGEAQRAAEADGETRIAGLRRELDELREARRRAEEEWESWKAQIQSDRSHELETLRAQLADAQARFEAAESQRADLELRLAAEHEQSEKRLAALRGELDKERMQLKQLVMQAAAQHNTAQAEMEALRGQLSGQKPGEIRSQDESAAEIDALRERIRELEARLEAGGALEIPPDLERYEAELHQFRQDLEAAQEALARREEEIEAQKEETLERLKQTELNLSRERAALARERAELDRLRREFQSEIEHAEREALTRARLAPVDRLASEVRGQPQEEPAAASLSQRLGGLLRRAQGR